MSPPVKVPTFFGLTLHTLMSPGTLEGGGFTKKSKRCLKIFKILNGEKLAEKELLDSLKPQPKSELEQAQDLLDQINNAHQLIDNKLADHEHEPLDLREKLDRLKESTSPGATPTEPETLSQKLERLKQKQAEQPKPKAEPKDDNDNDYSPF